MGSARPSPASAADPAPCRASAPAPAGAQPLQFGFLSPLLPGATPQSAVVRQAGCDLGTPTGLANTVTWQLGQVDPAVLTSLVSHVSRDPSEPFPCLGPPSRIKSSCWAACSNLHLPNL